MLAGFHTPLLQRGMQEERDAAAGLCSVPWQLLHSAQASAGPQLPSWEQLSQQREVSRAPGAADLVCGQSGVQRAAQKELRPQSELESCEVRPVAATY